MIQGLKLIDEVGEMPCVHGESRKDKLAEASTTIGC